MSFEIRPDYSFMIQAGEEEYLVDPRYDFIRLWPALGYGIINYISNEGVSRLVVGADECRRVAERGIPMVELDWIVESENEMIRTVQIDNMSDKWLQD